MWEVYLLSVCILYSILTVMYNPLFLMGTYTSVTIITVPTGGIRGKKSVNSVFHSKQSRLFTIIEGLQSMI